MDYEIKIGNKTRVLKIDTVPYKVQKIMANIEIKTAQLQILSEDERILNERVIELRRDRPEGWFGEVRGLRKECKELNREALEIINDAFFTERFDSVKMILSKNGIKEDDKIMDRKIWEEEIDRTVISDFINACLSMDKKKE